MEVRPSAAEAVAALASAALVLDPALEAPSVVASWEALDPKGAAVRVRPELPLDVANRSRHSDWSSTAGLNPLLAVATEAVLELL